MGDGTLRDKKVLAEHTAYVGANNTLYRHRHGAYVSLLTEICKGPHGTVAENLLMEAEDVIAILTEYMETKDEG